MKTKVDITTESVILKEWLNTYEKYMKQRKEGILYTSHTFDKMKQVYKNIYLSPLDFGELYFEIG